MEKENKIIALKKHIGYSIEAGQAFKLLNLRGIEDNNFSIIYSSSPVVKAGAITNSSSNITILYEEIIPNYQDFSKTLINILDILDTPPESPREVFHLSIKSKVELRKKVTP